MGQCVIVLAPTVVPSKCSITARYQTAAGETTVIGSPSLTPTRNKHLLCRLFYRLATMTNKMPFLFSWRKQSVQKRATESELQDNMVKNGVTLKIYGLLNIMLSILHGLLCLIFSKTYIVGLMQ